MLMRGMAVWFALIVAEIAHGVARAVWLVPLVGDWRSRQIGVGTGTIINFAVAALFIRWIRPRSAGDARRVGALWLLLTLTFELAFGRFVARASWPRIGSDYDLFHGGLLPLGLIMLGLAPLAAAKLRRVL
jgi:hypothetical protein